MDTADSAPAEGGKPNTTLKEKKQTSNQKPKPAGKKDGPEQKDRVEKPLGGKGGGIDSRQSHGKGTFSRGDAQRGASRLAVFDHLPRKKLLDMGSIESDRQLHPAIVRLGVLYSNGAIYDDDDRVCALYSAFCNVVEDYMTPPNKNLSWDLDKHVRLQVFVMVLYKLR